MTMFFQDKNPPRVWDRDLKKVTVIFRGGEFETEDPALIELLVRVGYRYDKILPEPVNKSNPGKTESPKPERMVRRKNDILRTKETPTRLGSQE